MSARFALRTKQLHKHYGRRPVLRGLDMNVPSGLVYGFLGRNGAGKTTTIRAIMGMIKADSGTIELAGRAVRRVLPAMREGVGYVSQEQHFYEWMRVEQLGRFVSGFYRGWDAQSFAALLSRLHIEPGQPVGDLSGGTKMKLAIALALAHQPPLLLLDEPTAGVDPIARTEILELLKAEAEDHGRTVVFSTHNISEVEAIGDVVGILHRGTMSYEGQVSALQQWVRKGSAPLPEPIHTLYTKRDHALGYASPQTWAQLGVPTQPATLDEIFYALTRELE